MTLFERYLDVLKEQDEEWYNLVEWKAGVNALTEHRRKKILSDLRSGRKHRPFPQRPDTPQMDWAR